MTLANTEPKTDAIWQDINAKGEIKSLGSKESLYFVG
jgi:hypothetical protein